MNITIFKIYPNFAIGFSISNVGIALQLAFFGIALVRKELKDIDHRHEHI